VGFALMSRPHPGWLESIGESGGRGLSTANLGAVHSLELLITSEARNGPFTFKANALLSFDVYSSNLPVLFFRNFRAPQSNPEFTGIAFSVSGGNLATFAYQVEPSPAIQQVLKSPPETAPISVPPSNSSTKRAYEVKEFDPSLLEGDDDPVPALMKLDGQEKNTDQRAEALVIQAKKLIPLCDDAGRWEREDRQHRIGDLLATAWGIYKTKHKYGVQSDFFQWFDAIPEYDRIVMLSTDVRETGVVVHRQTGQEHLKLNLKEEFKSPDIARERLLRPSVVKAFLRGVKYLDKATRPDYVVSFEGNIAKYRGGAFDTTAMQTVFSGKGFAIWVMDESGVLYAGNHIYGQMHHSSFLAGNDVLSGGEIRARNGKIEFLSGKSGHYQPPMQSLINALKKLENQAVELSGFHVLVWEKADLKPSLVSAQKVVENGMALYDSWGGPLKPALKECLQAGNYDQFDKIARPPSSSS